MSLTFEQTKTVFKLYPTVITIINNIAYDADGNVVEYDSVAVQKEADKMSCAEQAKAILTATDWTQAADCPLVNKAEFTAYRATVRALAINPVANPTFPELPTEQWN
ncbi:MAG: hypothetical protein ACOVLB_08155 [Candidatus Nanopelagicus sp.]